jgi:EAL domain-containing protein (putative c-di-GMP-specific phosphodiesterase class I)
MAKVKDKYRHLRESKPRLYLNSFKDQIKNNVCQARLINKIHIGIDRDEFTLFYQPEYNLVTKEITGVEALVRWVPSGNGIIYPEAFIPIAEKSQIIYQLERMIIHKALQQKLQWEREGLGHIELSINLSSKSLESEKDFTNIERILSSYKVNYKTIIFEITETMVITNINIVMERLNRLRKHGIRIALDDFGTGYSSLIHLIRLPIDIIKIDRSFIKSIPDCNGEKTITKSILGMAHGLNYKVVAEGIETKEQLKYLQQNACEGGQGFLLCIPLPSYKVTDVIKGKKLM